MAVTVESEQNSEPSISAQKCAFHGTELRWKPDGAAVSVRLLQGSAGKRVLALGDKEVALADIRMVSQLSPTFVTMQVKDLGHVGLQCEEEKAFAAFVSELSKCKSDYERFEQYDQSSVQSYFQYYAKLANQQNMLQDSVRTTIYQNAIVTNPSDFAGKTVMDIGAGSGILSFFACQAGASRVYAVEASSAADTVKVLAEANKINLGGAEVVVINKPLEMISDDEVPVKVDALVSEPIGTFLFNERMIETYLCARDRFLKPGGKMYPNVGNLCIAPFSDATLHGEQQAKNAFWKNNNFYGLDLSAAVARSTQEHFTQPIVDYVNPECLVSPYMTTRFDFATVTVESLRNIEIPFVFEISQPCLVHGIAGWFDCLFEGTDQTVNLSTAPWMPGTHWYQIRFLLQTPLAVNAGQKIQGVLNMEANNVQSYHIRIQMNIQGTSIHSDAHKIDLKDPEYRFFTSANTYVPPGTDGAFGQQAAQQQPQQQPQQTQQQKQEQQEVEAVVASSVAGPTITPGAQKQQVGTAWQREARSRSASRRVR